jgi:hypothetical protein
MIVGDVEERVVVAHHDLLDLADQRHQARQRRLGLLCAGTRLRNAADDDDERDEERASHGASVAWALALLSLFGALACAKPPPAPVEPPAPPAEEALPFGPLPCERIVRIEVRKAAREVVAHCEGGASLRMTAAMGREPRGHKVASGDLRTPEGLYRIAGPLERNRFHGFVPIDYPSLADADAALADGRITASDHARIADAHARGVQPPVDTPLGGDIGIHGEGARWAGDSLHLDWTYGCIAVSDPDLDFIAPRVQIGVEIEILP